MFLILIETESIVYNSKNSWTNNTCENKYIPEFLFRDIQISEQKKNVCHLKIVGIFFPFNKNYAIISNFSCVST